MSGREGLEEINLPLIVIEERMKVGNKGRWALTSNIQNNREDSVFQLCPPCIPSKARYIEELKIHKCKSGIIIRKDQTYLNKVT